MDANRSTTIETPESITNILSRGGTEDWKQVYAQARIDGRFRQEVRRRLATVDVEVSEGVPGLWTVLLENLDRSAQGIESPSVSGTGR